MNSLRESETLIQHRVWFFLVELHKKIQLSDKFITSQYASNDDDDDDNFIAIYMYITRHTCNGMRFAPELLHSMLPTIQSFHPYST